MNETSAGGQTEHRTLAVSTYQHCWQLLDNDRTEAQDRDLVGLAFTSRYHWSLAGGSTEHAIADWMVSRCLAAVGDGPLARVFAESSLGHLEDDSPAWLRASLYEGLARACAADGDRDGRDAGVERARRELAEETDPEDRELIEAQLDDVP